MIRSALAVLVSVGVAAQESNFKRTDSRAGFAHHIELYDADGRKIDLSAEDAKPYSPRRTCGKCHDVAALEHGLHFSAATASEHGRPGEPWILSDARTGTQLPLSYRGFAGTRHPRSVGLDGFAFVQEFGRHMPGGMATYTGEALDGEGAATEGDLEIDCLVCHGADRSWSQERWAAANAERRFASAPMLAAGLGHLEGAGETPRTVYDARRVDLDGKVFFDVVRTPPDTACYRCHTAIDVGEGVAPRWLHDGDVHLRAGMHCADCHGNGVDHHTVRGFPGERHPSGADVRAASCSGCHEGDGASGGGRFAAPVLRHRGLPPLHFEKLTCTACHSGPEPAPEAGAVQTALAHALGLPSQTRAADDLPRLVQPVLRRDASGRIAPHRGVWPAFWGLLTDAGIEPVPPADAYKVVRRHLRIRRDLARETAELPRAELEAGIAATLEGLAAGHDGATPVLVTGGRAWRVQDGALAAFDHSAAAPYFWPIAHDVRPARQALGAGGCTDCHAAGAPFLHGAATPAAPFALATAPPSRTHEALGFDAGLIAAWEQAFGGRTAFKVAGVLALLVLGVAILAGCVRVFDRDRRAPDVG